MISVIVPVFNCEAYLKKCIESILNQSYSDYELILVNHNSTDNSRQICKEYEKRDSRIQVLDCKQKGGAGVPRNTGIQVAKGEYYVFLDSDDFIQEDMLKNLFIGIQGVDCVICGYDRTIWGKEKPEDIVQLESKLFLEQKAVRDYFLSTFPHGNAGYLWNKMYRADLIQKHHIMFPADKRLEDGYFNIDYFAHVKALRILPDILYHYRLNAQKDLFVKSPPNYYEIVKKMVNYYYQKVEEWGYIAKEVDREAVFFFLNELELCLENVLNPTWNIQGKQRIEYYEKLLADEMVQVMLSKKQVTGVYVKKVLTYLENRQFIRMKMCILLKVYTKKYCGRLFRWMKKAVNQ